MNPHQQNKVDISVSLLNLSVPEISSSPEPVPEPGGAAVVPPVRQDADQEGRPTEQAQGEYLALWCLRHD